MPFLLLLALVVFIVFRFNGSDEPSYVQVTVPEAVTVTQQEYGDEWPFPAYTAGQIDCEPAVGGRYYVTIQLGSTTFGLNGAAQDPGGYRDARSQMDRHPEYDTYLLGGSREMIQRGLAVCER